MQNAMPELPVVRPDQYPEAILSVARGSPYSGMVLRAWALFQAYGRKAEVHRRLKGEYPDKCPTLETVERWLRAGEASANEQVTATEALPAVVSVREGESALSEIVRDTDGAKPTERIAATRLLWERQGALAPREVRVRHKHEIINTQPLAILNAVEAELDGELELLPNGQLALNGSAVNQNETDDEGDDPDSSTQE